MTPEIGHFCLVLALCLAAAQAFFGLAGALRANGTWMAVVRPAATGHLVFVAIAFAFLVNAFLSDDFSMLYVANNSNTALPVMYKVSAVWGAHEGSLLLWILVQAAWSVAVCALSRSLPERLTSAAIGVLGLISVGFVLFTLGTSNPFDRLLPAAAEGRDLNPLLQDPALAVHPPMLYIGYVGLSVAFAFAVSAMLLGRLDSVWAKWVRPWTTAAWIFLTLGIALGSWWAYYELGWGGWWFWDPVENASFMPWLVGTALIHSLAVTEKRGLFRSWTLLLAVSAFSLSLLGTFLVRSGVLVSVHAFATDPSRGIFILALLAFFIGGSLALYAWRAPSLAQSGGFKALSRETFLLFNNMLLVVAAALILIGTLWPIFVDAITGAKVSIGPMIFAILFLIPAFPLVLLMGLGMHTAWTRDDPQRLRSRLGVLFAGALVLGAVVPWAIFGSFNLGAAGGTAAALWLAAASLREPLRWLWQRKTLRGYPRAVLGMSTAHFGVAVFTLGVAITTAYDVSRDVPLKPGESHTVSGYEFRFDGTREVQGPNYAALEAQVTVLKDGRDVTVLLPQKRIYRVQQNPMTEAGIQPRLDRDLFVALGDSLGEGAWSFRIQYKPLVRAIWLGCIIMALGGLLAASDRRYRVARRAEAPTTGTAAGEGA